MLKASYDGRRAEYYGTGCGWSNVGVVRRIQSTSRLSGRPWLPLWHRTASQRRRCLQWQPQLSPRAEPENGSLCGIRRSRFLHCLPDSLPELIDPLIECRSDRQDRDLTHAAFELFQIFLCYWFVHLVGHDQAWLLEESRIIQLQFVEQISVIVPWGPAIRAGHVQQENQHLATFDVSQEFMAQPNVSVCALNQTRHVANREPEVICVFHDPDLRMQRCKRIGSDFGPSVGDCSQQRGFTGIRVTDQSHFSYNAQLEEERSVVARLPWLGKSRSLASSRGKVAIAESSPATFAEREALSMLC